MDSQKVDLFLLTKQKNFEPEHLTYLRDQLSALTDDQFVALQTVELQDPTLMLVISIFGGSLGIDRFLLGDVALGILKLITGGACGIWTIVDLFFVMGATRRKNFERISQFLSFVR